MDEKLFAKEAGSERRLEVKRYGYLLDFIICADSVDCYCSYEPATTGGAPLSDVELQGFLKQFKITEGIIPEATASLLHCAATAQAVQGLLVAHGIPMVPGEDGYIELVVADDLAENRPEEVSATVDLRRVQAFLNVNKEDLIGTLHLPGAGTAGTTISGMAIPAQPGAPLELEMGQNVRLGDDGLSIYATAAGRVYSRDNEISVEDIYEIDGDVGFKVGNIVFNGFVEVKGDVQDGFTIKASKGVKVHGVVGVCTIESEGNIAFSGINGQGKGTIRCGGTLSANFIYETSIECDGDVLVETEIRNATIRCLGSVRVNKNGLAGGEYFALAGIETAILGNVAHVPTRVVVGVHYRDLEELNQHFSELKQLIAEYTAAEKGTIDPKEFARKRSEITDRTQSVRSRSYERSNPKINVSKKLYEGVNITLGGQSDIIKEERKGPISIIENTIEGGLRFLGMTQLNFKAQAIEQTFLHQHKMEQQNKNN